MRPYYEEPGIQIFHANCWELLADLAADMVVTDPPYGMALELDWATRKGGKWGLDHPPVSGDGKPFDPRPLLRFPRLVLFGANYYADKLPPSGAWIVWDKKRGGTVTPGWNSTDAELAWTNFDGGVRVFSHLWAGYKRDSEIGEHYHPTQKPRALMAWIIARWTKPIDVVLDPFMGSGTTLRAAKDLGRRAIGIEIEERYCEIAARRLGQEVLALA